MPPEETARTMMLALDVARLLGSSSLVIIREPDADLAALATALLRESPAAWFRDHALMVTVGDDRGFLIFGVPPPPAPVPFDRAAAERAGATLVALARVQRRERPTA